MARAHVLVALAAALAMSPCISRAVGEEPPVRLVGSGSGTLAAAPEQGKPWTVLQPGDPVPPRCQLRSAAGGVCELQLPSGLLLISGGSQLELDALRQHVVLTVGRVLLDTRDQAGSCDAGGGHFTLTANSKVEVSASAESTSIAVVNGSAAATHPDCPPLVIHEQQSIGWKAADHGWSPKSLTEDELHAIAAWTNARPAQGLGQLLISDAQAGSPTRLNIGRYYVNVVLEPPVALVQIDQSFYNPLPRQEEGTFVFNLPSGASVSRFAMYVSPTSLVEGELIERQQAASIYQSIVNQRRDPAILEQIGDHLFKMRVFPMPPNDSKRILLDFTLPLETRDGQYVFRLPLLTDLKPIWDFRITGSLRGPTVPGSVKIDSPYNLHPASRGDAIRFDLSERMFQPQDDLTVRFRQKIEGQPVVRSFKDDHDPYRDRERTYFWAALPPDPQAGPPDVSPADVLVLIDTSGSGQDRRQLTDSLSTLLGGLRPTDRFRLACVDISARSLSDWRPAEPAHVAAALAAFDRELFLGGVDLVVSCTEALKLKDALKRRQMIVYLGSAEESASQLPAKKLADSLCQQLVAAGMPFFAATSQRTTHGRTLLDALAGGSGGMVFDLSLAEGRQGFFGWLLSGLPLPTQIQSLQVSGVDADDLFYPAAWPAGQILPITGRYEAGKTLEISAVLGRKGAERLMKLSLPGASEQDDVFVGRCWAQRKLDALRAQETAAAGPNDALRKYIAALSQEWSLLSPHTAFLVLESEQDYVRWKIDRRQRHRYWRPLAANIEEPLPDHWVRLVSSDRAAPAPDGLRSGLAKARQALDQQNFLLARQQLGRLEQLPEAVLSPDYKALKKQIEERDASRARAAALHASLRSLAASRRADDEAQIAPQLARLLVGEISSDFLERFPLASGLLQDARMRGLAATSKAGKPVEPITLEDLCRQMEASTGIHVQLDKRALEDAGASTDAPLTMLLHSAAPISWRSFLRLALPPMDLDFVESRRRLTITTREQAESTLSLQIYPVADLLLADRQPDRELLSNPYLDLRLGSEARIKSKLKQAVSFNFNATALDDVAEYFSTKLGINVLVDARALADAGAGTDTPVTARCRDESASESLRVLLRPMDMAYVIQDEALVITTKEKADAALHVRLHNGAGVVYESTRPAVGLGVRGQGGGMGAGGAMAGGGGTFGGGFSGMGGMMSGVRDSGSTQRVVGLQDDTPVVRPPPQDAASAASALGGFTQTAALDLRISQHQVARGRVRGLPAKVPVPVAAPFGTGATSPMVTVFDTDTVMDLVTTNVAPTTWDEVGGPGSLAFFEPTLDFVLSTTDDVHDQIDHLFAGLRKIPIIPGPNLGRAALHGRPATIEEAPRALENLIDIIMTTLAPTTWDEVGGPGNVVADPHRLALVLAQTGNVHESLTDLLTMLRRSRAGLRLRQPETILHGPGHGPLVDALAIAAGKPRGERQSATAEELQLLRIRREPANGRWQWRRTDAQGDSLASFSLKRSAARFEIETPGWIARCEGESAALAYPGLTLFERGPWAAAVRELLDARLPWWPHRTNQELAELFEIQPVSSAPAEPPGAVWLRFRTPDADQSDYLQMAFSRDLGLPILWQSYLGGQLLQSIRFAAQATGLAPTAQHATLEAADGQTLLRWHLDGQSVDDPQLSDLNAGWPDYVELHPAAGDGPLAKGLSAARKSDWPAAIQTFSAAHQARPQQPLLALLWAWSVMRASADRPQPAEGTKPVAWEEVVKVLQDVARQGASELVQFISPGNFSLLSPKELLAVLESQPAQLRAADDWQRLIATASEARLVPQALAHAAEAAALAKNAEQQFACERWRIDVLLAANRSADAASSVADWVRQHRRVRPAKLAELACLLAENGEREAADPFMRQVISAADLPDELKSQYARRYADALRDLPRWRSLVEAIQFLSPDADSRTRQEMVNQLLMELRSRQSVNVCEQLAMEIGDPDLRVSVQLLLAHMTPQNEQAADTFWSLREAGLLPEFELFAACASWNAAGHAERTIGVLEPRVRQGALLPYLAFDQLATAYQAAGRSEDARRAASQPAKLHHSHGNPPESRFQGDLPGYGGGFF